MCLPQGWRYRLAKCTRNTSLEAQKGYNPLADSMINQISWHLANREADPIQYLNFVRPVMQWYNGRTMDNYVGKELDKRYQEYREDPANLRSKAVIDLVLQAYMADVPSPPEKMDKNFRTFAIRQIRLFVFVGHDSTSSTICYLFHLLNTNPETLARVRAEHDSVFGTDLTALPPLLSKNPHLINQLPYSTAAIKETLRLFPAASTIRQGAPGEDLVDEAGNRYPTENTMMLIVHPTMQRSPSYWPRPDEFIPERWLVEPSHELYPLKAAWRPFEWGPRNCMGQALVMMELKTVLAMIVREFDFTPAYDEFDKAHPKKGPRTYRGDRAYQIEEGAAHPSDHYPCRVSLAQRQKIVRG